MSREVRSTNRFRNGLLVLGAAAAVTAGVLGAGSGGRASSPAASLLFDEVAAGRPSALSLFTDKVRPAGPSVSQSEVEANAAPAEPQQVDQVPDGAAASTAAEESAPPPPAAPSATWPAVPPPAPAAASVASNVVLVGSEHWDAVSLANVQQALALLPPSVLAQLGNPAFGPVYISVNDQGRTPSGMQPYGGPANFYMTYESRNDVVLYPQQSVQTIVHELGHAYNLRRSPAGNYASVLLDPEMQSFLQATGWRVLTPATQLAGMYDHSQVSLAYDGGFTWPRVSRNDPLEDFANSFAMYFVDPAGLASQSPERYGWFSARFP